MSAFTFDKGLIAELNTQRFVVETRTTPGKSGNRWSLVPIWTVSAFTRTFVNFTCFSEELLVFHPNSAQTAAGGFHQVSWSKLFLSVQPSAGIHLQ